MFTYSVYLFSRNGRQKFSAVHVFYLSLLIVWQIKFFWCLRILFISSHSMADKVFLVFTYSIYLFSRNGRQKFSAVHVFYLSLLIVWQIKFFWCLRILFISSHSMADKVFLVFTYSIYLFSRNGRQKFGVYVFYLSLLIVWQTKVFWCLRILFISSQGMADKSCLVSTYSIHLFS